MSNKLASLVRDLDHIRKHRVEVKSQRERLASRLSELNKDLKSKKISYELYESKYNYILGGKTTEEKKKYFKKRLVAINHREKDLIARIKHENHAIKNKSKLIAVTAIMFAIIVPMVSIDIGTLTGFTTYNDTSVTGLAVIPSFYAINLSDALDTSRTNEYIQFGDLVGSEYLVIPGTQYENATKSYTGTNSIPEYHLTLSSDSNTDVRTCIKGIAWSGPASLAVGSINWGSKIGPTATLPATPGTTMTTTFAQTQALITPGQSEHYRFWLTTSAQQTSGDYNTTITFKATATGSTC